MKLVLYDDGSEIAAVILARIKEHGIPFRSVPSDEFGLQLEGGSAMMSARHDAHRLIRDVLSADRRRLA
jgi:hypothetical protein